MICKKFTLTAIILIAFMPITIPQLLAQHNSPYADLSHESKVFGHEKLYRIYLPVGYGDSIKAYPVIYFFHGWGGRHFKDDNALLEYEKIKELVDRYEIILVMWDGNMEESNPRPYNIGNHKDIVYDIQMKDYFIELIAHIDSSYRTLSNRNHRAIIGFSMGGIMSFFLAGKYPDKISAAVNLAGTPEFFIGYPGNHTLYPVRYTFKNLMDVSTRQHGGDTDILVYLNEEVRKGAEWEGNPYEFYSFQGGHMVDKIGETRVFEMAVKFIADAFNTARTRTERWSHYDLYDRFDVWNYSVTSNKTKPGFIFLKNVSEQGFGLYTHKWLPDGPQLDSMEISVTTDSCYVPGKKYTIIMYLDGKKDPGIMVQREVVANKEGRLVLDYHGSNIETGIYSHGDTPDLIAAGYKLNDHNRYLTAGENKLYLTMLNRGGDNPRDLKVLVSITTRNESVIIQNEAFPVDLKAYQRVIDLPPITIQCNKKPPGHGEPFQVKLNMAFQFDDKIQKDDITLPVLFDVPAFDSIRVDDGIVIRDKPFGIGNGNGIAEAGEKVMLYFGDHRLRLYTNDQWIVSEEEELCDEQLPSVWEDGFALSSIVTMAKDCPEGHTIAFTASYETNTYNPIERKVHWGKVNITTGKQK
jgi:enterochelin esterase-like enzyme